MAAEEGHAVFNEDDFDDDEDDEEEDEDLNPSGDKPSVPSHSRRDDVVVDEEDDDVDVDDDDVGDSTSSSNLGTADHGHPVLSLQHLPTPLPPPAAADSSAAAGEVTVALPADQSLTQEPKRPRIDDVTVAGVSAVASVIMDVKKPVPLDESRRLFQRLWTDEDEIELLQGFLHYTASRGPMNSSHHHDTTAFYDQIKSKLQLDFNKNQLVEKLRRLKKKYRNVMNKIATGKDYGFKSAHDQATFEISRKIWSGGGGGSAAAVRGGLVTEEGGFDDEDANPNYSVHGIDQSPNPNGVDINSFDKKTPRPRKRSRVGGVKIEEKRYGFDSVPNLQHCNQQDNMQNAATGAVIPTATVMGTGSGLGTNLIEQTLKNCLSPIFKELLNNVMSLNGSMCGLRGLGLGFAFSPMPLGLNGDLVADEKWRKQQILELEVYSKRLDLVQDQIKAQLEELRSTGS